MSIKFNGINYIDELKEKENKIKELEVEIMGLKEENKKYHDFFRKLIEDATKEMDENEIEMIHCEKKVKAIQENLEKKL
jgi:hypothetical protein